MKILIAIVGCEARKDRMHAQRVTWAKDFANDSDIDVRFFLARQEREPLPEEVFVDVDDGYLGLPAKSREVSRWARPRGYDWILKTDDDSLVFARKLRVPDTGVDYAGWVHRPLAENWCSGLAYWLSRRSMEVIADSSLEPLKDSPFLGNAEDRWTGYSLKAAGIKVVNDPGILFVNKHQRPLPRDIYPRMRPGYAVGEFSAAEMPFIYAGCS
jgi:hypothetical protein